MKRALSVTSECAPLVKTGGLADVAGALPGALEPEGWELRTILPGYPIVLDAIGEGKTVMTSDDLFGGKATVRSVEHEGLGLFILDAPHLYARKGMPYTDENGNDFPDNPRRFAALSFVAARIANVGAGDWKPTVLHGHDWQAGLAALYLDLMGGGAGTVLTIHNMAFHGIAPPTERAVLGLPADRFNRDGYEFWGNISTLKAGLVYSDKITTVSPSYASELLTPEFGMGLDGLLRARSGDLTGILNGIDADVWNPKTDPHISTYSSPAGKSKAKAQLQQEFGLPEASGPLCGVISRLSDQKGLDVLLDALPALIDRGGQFVMLGSGDRQLEQRYRDIAQHPNVAVRIGYDEPLSHRIMAGCDAILVPSRFEPCGLTQLYGLRYGTVPVVAYTGGLIDTVIHASPMALRSGVATGIQFHPVTAHALANALMQTVELYQAPDVWRRLQKNGMKQDVSWSASAPAYAALYDEIATA